MKSTMWQMGGPGPMLGQVLIISVKYNKGKAPYAEERYLKEAHRLYGVLYRQLAERESWRATTRSPTSRSGHRSPLRRADHRHEPVPEREALVCGDRQPSGGEEGLTCSTAISEVPLP